MRFRKIHKVILVALSVCAVVFYFAFIGRAHATFHKDDWHMELSYIRMACRTCSSQIEKLEYRGQSIAPPKHWKLTKAPTFVEFATPVAVLKWFPQVSMWRFEHVGTRTQIEVDNQVTESEIASGYYDLSDEGRSNQPPGIPKKKGTPVGWIHAFVASSDNYYFRWCDPLVIDTLKW